MLVLAEFAHLPVPEWSESGLMLDSQPPGYHRAGCLRYVAAPPFQQCKPLFSHPMRRLGRHVPALERRYDGNMQIVATNGRPCTLRLRRNYGLRNLGNPLPPHRPPRSAAPAGAPYRQGVLICNDASRCGKDASRLISSKEQ
jgi:hypothetical protein